MDLLLNKDPLFKIFSYKIRIAIPEITNKHSLYAHTTILNNFREKLCNKLKQDHKKFRVWKHSSEGMDNERGHYLEVVIQARTHKSNPDSEKIIWITY